MHCAPGLDYEVLEPYSAGTITASLTSTVKITEHRATQKYQLDHRFFVCCIQINCQTLAQLPVWPANCKQANAWC